MVDYLLLAEQRAKNKNEVENDLDFTNFLGACFVKCSSQSYGPKIEKRIINDFGFGKIPQKNGEGDFKAIEKTKFPFYEFKLGERCELKISFLSSNKSWNLIQLRPYESFEYYVFLLINPLNKCAQEWFVIKKEDINENNFKLNATHGTKKSNKLNKNIEYKLTVDEKGNVLNKLRELNKVKNV